MDTSCEPSLDLKILDLSIVFTDIDAKPQKSGFWRYSMPDENMSLTGRKLIKDVHIETPICGDYSIFANKIAELHEAEIVSTAEGKKIERPVEVDDQVVECTPQFILRNIPKLEKYYDLSNPLPFSVSDLPLAEVVEDILDARNTKIKEIEFPDHDSIAYVNDFRSFLEEIFYLCPWEQITRKAPTEDNPWHINNSVSKLAKEMLANKERIFIYSDSGVSTKQMSHEMPAEKSNAQSSSMPSLPGGFGASFGPR